MPNFLIGFTKTNNDKDLKDSMYFTSYSNTLATVSKSNACPLTCVHNLKGLGVDKVVEEIRNGST